MQHQTKILLATVPVALALATATGTAECPAVHVGSAGEDVTKAIGINHSSGMHRL
ncbi:MAG: hypothetical protein ACUVWX_13095 [Kiritimatiellia bacterium]